jgi:hypothetical protein
MIAYALRAEGRPRSLIPPAMLHGLYLWLHQSYAERPQILANAAKSFIYKGF